MKRFRTIMLSLLLLLVFMALGTGGIAVYKAQQTLGTITSQHISLIDTLDFFLPFANTAATLRPELAAVPAPQVSVDVQLPRKEPLDDPNRLNILLLGIRGANDPHGGLLSDAIAVASIDLAENRVALLSIPRDLYVVLPRLDRYQKINAAYAFGEARFGSGLELAIETVSNTAGIRIHHGIRVDMAAFEKIIDDLGGIDVEVQRDFVGTDQEGISLQRGTVHMDGRTALRYTRSRQTTNDFDRSRRQREVLRAMRAKAVQTKNPLHFLELFDTLGAHVRTTLSVQEIKALMALVHALDFNALVEVGFDASASSPLMSTRSERGEYILVPRTGDFTAFQQVFQSVFR